MDTSPNRLLASLPPGTVDRLNIRKVALKSKQVLMEEDQNIDYFYFPTDVVVSSLTVMSDGTAIEVACIGNDGLVGASVVLGSTTATHNGVVQVPGEALRTGPASLVEACAADA